jgi:hypothetical protein
LWGGWRCCISSIGGGSGGDFFFFGIDGGQAIVDGGVGFQYCGDGSRWRNSSRSRRWVVDYYCKHVFF